MDATTGILRLSGRGGDDICQPAEDVLILKGFLGCARIRRDEGSRPRCQCRSAEHVFLTGSSPSPARVRMAFQNDLLYSAEARPVFSSVPLEGVLVMGLLICLRQLRVDHGLPLKALDFFAQSHNIGFHLVIGRHVLGGEQTVAASLGVQEHLPRPMPWRAFRLVKEFYSLCVPP